MRGTSINNPQRIYLFIFMIIQRTVKAHFLEIEKAKKYYLYSVFNLALSTIALVIAFVIAFNL